MPALLVLIFMAIVPEAWSAPFSRLFSYRQPDGTFIQLRGQGDEFFSVFETLDGYTAVFNAATLAHQYAMLSPDGNALLPTGLDVGKGDPASLGLRKHLRINPAAARRQFLEKRSVWEQRTGVAQRWAALKAASSASLSRVEAPPTTPTIGTKVGLCLPVCFKDSPADAEIKPGIEEIRNYYSGDTDSIKAYFLHNSNGLLTLSHNITKKWIRVSREKSYYDDPKKKYSVQGRLVIDEALDILMKNPTEYGLSEMIQNATTDSSGAVESVSIIYYGASLNIDDRALYPHQGSLEDPINLGSQKKLKDYAFTDCGRSFNLATMCHEIGHMACGFPDLYRNSVVEGGDRLSGVGALCLMGLGDEQSEVTPAQFSAYLKYKAGWATAVQPAGASATLDALRGAGTLFNKFLRFPKGGVETAKEYFLVENRNKSGWDQYLPGSGIVIYYVDEEGRNLEPKSDPNWSTPRYECMVMEADGDFSLLKDKKEWGQPNDLFFKSNSTAGYANAFSDSTVPNSKWRDGSTSGLKLTDFSEASTSMSFTIVSPTKLAVTGLNGTPPGAAAGILSDRRGLEQIPSANSGQHLRAGAPFSVTVTARDSSGDAADVETDTVVELSLRSGTGRLGGTLSGTIQEGTASVTIHGVTYSKAENGIVLEVRKISGDNLEPGESEPFDEESAPWLVITDVNSGINPIAGVPFTVAVQAQDDAEQLLRVGKDTQVSLTLTSGTGTLSGTISGIIPAGSHSVTLGSVTYSKAETDVEISASATGGDTLSEGDSDPFDVMANAYTAAVDVALTGGAASSQSTSGMGSQPRVGYAVGTVTAGSAPYGVAVFSYRNFDTVVSEAAVPASPPVSSSRVFIDYRSGVAAVPGSATAGAIDINTGIALVNRSTAAARITYTLRDRAGSTLTSGSGTLAAGSHFAKFVNQLQEAAPGFMVPGNFNTATGFGSLDIVSDQAVSVTALRLTVNQRNEVLLTSTPSADLAAASSRAPLYFPQFADGGGYTTTIILLNTSNAPETGSLALIGDTGTPIVASQVGGARASSFAYSIPPGGVFVFQTDGASISTNVGWVRVTPEANSSSPVGAGVFSFSQDGILVTESGVPAALPTTHARIYIDQSGSHSTGLAIANPGTAGISLNLKAYRRDGVTAAGDETGSIALSGNGHGAAFVSQLVTGLPSGFTGVLDISSAAPFAALTLRSLINSRGNFLLTTFPIADAMQPAPAPIVFPQIADGGGYVTEFILLSPGGQARTLLSFYGQDGTPLAVGK